MSAWNLISGVYEIMFSSLSVYLQLAFDLSSVCSESILDLLPVCAVSFFRNSTSVYTRLDMRWSLYDIYVYIYRADVPSPK